jgi:hypothetical protein
MLGPAGADVAAARRRPRAQAQVVDMEAGLEETRGTFQALDGQMRALSHAAAKIGDRLQARRAPRRAARAARATACGLG